MNPATSRIRTTLTATGRLFFARRRYDVAVGVVLVLAVVCSLVLQENLLPFRVWAQRNLLSFFGIGALSMFVVSLVRALQNEQPARVGAAFLAFVRRKVPLHLAVELLRFCVALELVMSSYTLVKQRIPRLNPGLVDAQLLTVERWLHFGVSPAHALQQATLPGPLAWLLDEMYVAWFLVKAVVIGYALTLEGARRERFLTAYLLLWTVGAAVGVLMPSVGPFYPMDGRFPVEGMTVAALTQAHLGAHYDQHLAIGKDGAFEFGWGLMAMPSLHVAACTLYGCLFWRARPLLRVASLVYLALIFVGSLASGWHYAIDGYVGGALAVAVWWLAGRLGGRAPAEDART